MAERNRIATSLLVLSVLALSGCGGSSKPAPIRTPPRTIVDVTLQDFAVAPARNSAPAGLMSFQPRNKGPKHKHEFVLVKTSLAADKLPVKANGAVDEESSKLTLVGKIEGIPVGSTGARTFTLAAGSYVLFCNIVEKKGSTTFVHYKLGMRAGFTVN